MSLNIRALLCVILWSCFFSLPANANESNALKMSLATYRGQKKLQHPSNFPLLLKVLISTTGEPVKIKMSSKSIKDSIRFLASDAKNAYAVPIEVSPMAEDDSKNVIVIDQNNSIFLQFGIDSEQWNKSETKSVDVIAELNLLDSDIKLRSNILKIEFIDPQALPIKSLDGIQDNFEAGSFYVLQKNSSKVEIYAKNLEPVAASLAWDLRGDAFLGQGNKIEAKKAYRKSLDSNDVILPEQMRLLTGAKLHELESVK